MVWIGSDEGIEGHGLLLKGILVIEDESKVEANILKEVLLDGEESGFDADLNGLLLAEPGEETGDLILNFGSL